MNSSNLHCDKVEPQFKYNVFKPRKSIGRRKSLKLVRDARLKMQNMARNARKGYIGDRIMINRACMDFDNMHDILLCRANRDENTSNDDLSVPSLIEKTMYPSSSRLLKLNAKHMSPSYDDKIKALYERNKSTKTSQSKRCISLYPERILDAPMLSSQCWNIIDWNYKGLLAVALGSSVYLWEATTGTVTELINDGVQAAEISCLKWFNGERKNILAVGNIYGKLTLWRNSKLYKTINTNCNLKITAMACTNLIFSIGFQSGLIQHYDHNMTLSFSNDYLKKTVHQIQWSINNVYLAVSSKDGSVSVWTNKKLKGNPMTHFQENNTGITGITWSPNKEHILLYAGGDDNYVLKIMDVITKCCIKSLSGNCRMSCVYWSTSFNEVAVSVNNDNGECCIRLYNDTSLKSVTEMSGHKGEIIAMTCNPVTGMLTTIGRDESIRFWSCFKDDNLKSKTKQATKLTIFDGFHRFR